MEIILILLVVAVLLWIAFRITGALLSAIFWLVIRLPAAILVFVIGVILCCTIILLPSGLRLIGLAWRILFG